MLSLLNIDYSSMISTLPLDSGSSDSLSNFINNGLIGLVTEADTTYKIAGSVIALILALIGCFFGYKLSRLFMGITGFIAGAIIGQIVASQILHVEGFATETDTSKYEQQVTALQGIATPSDLTDTWVEQPFEQATPSDVSAQDTEGADTLPADDAEAKPVVID